MNMYQYTENQRYAMGKARELDGELDDDLINLFDNLDISRDEIIDFEHRKIKNQNWMIDSIAEEIKMLKNRADEIKLRRDKDVEKLNEFMAPEIKEGKTLKRVIGDIKFTTKGGSCVLNDKITVDDIPAEFWIIKTSTTADMAGLKKQLSSRSELSKYVHLTDKVKGVSIK